MRPEAKTEIGVLYGFRALMVLMVCNFHIWQQSWLAQGLTLGGCWVSTDFLTRSSYLFVDGMMLLSGFLLFLPYARQSVLASPVPTPRTFYRKRLLRIVPSYLFSVLVMLAVAMAEGRYATTGALLKDVFAHLTFTFLFFPDTMLYTPLGTALWTVAVEMQFYLIFPLLVRAAQKKPALTLTLMGAAGLAYRLLAAYRWGAGSMLINQLPSFLDVYALGFLGAMLYVRLDGWQGKQRTALRWLSLALFAVCLPLLGELLRMQSATSQNGLQALHVGQLLMRLPFAAVMLVCMLAASLMPRPAQRLLDNRLMRFLSTVSFNLYIWHQIIASRLAANNFPASLHSDRPLQIAFTLLCFSLSIVVSMLTTFGIEKPAVSLAHKIRLRRNQHERPTFTHPQPPTGPLLLRPEEGRASAD